MIHGLSLFQPGTRLSRQGLINRAREQSSASAGNRAALHAGSSKALENLRRMVNETVLSELFAPTALINGHAK